MEATTTKQNGTVWLPCIDEPNVRTTLDVRNTSPGEYVRLGPGYLVMRTRTKTVRRHLTGALNNAAQAICSVLSLVTWSVPKAEVRRYSHGLLRA